MSESGFHSHFKAVTAMSPRQFQKQLRLQEARRLMLKEGLDAVQAGHRVGYDDASRFSRDYKRLFGEPPKRDVESMREVARANADDTRAVNTRPREDQNGTEDREGRKEEEIGLPALIGHPSPNR